VKKLAVLNVMAELELLVGEQVAVRVQDALGQARGTGGVVSWAGSSAAVSTGS